MAIMDKRICFGKKLNVTLFVIANLYINSLLAHSGSDLINVKIGLMESLSPMAPSSSDRYKKFYESAIFYAIGENEAKLQKCGYKLTSSIVYFDTYDAQELINTTKKLEDSNAWVIIGPRRSNQFITASKALTETPLISTMANADCIYKLNHLTFSMYPSASTLAGLMIKEVEKHQLGNKYGTLVDVRCSSCVDFAKSYRNNNAHQEAFYIEVASNTPDLEKLKQYLAKHPIDYLVLSNYSDLSGYVISEVQKHYPSIKYIGSDGWGEDSFTLMHGFGIGKIPQAFLFVLALKKKRKVNITK